jgi:hypothetical protein
MAALHPSGKRVSSFYGSAERPDSKGGCKLTALQNDIIGLPRRVKPLRTVGVSFITPPESAANKEKKKGEGGNPLLLIFPALFFFRCR